MLPINFFTFLGLAINELSYWGGRKEKSHKHHRMTKLNPLNQFFNSHKTKLVALSKDKIHQHQLFFPASCFSLASTILKIDLVVI